VLSGINFWGESPLHLVAEWTGRPVRFHGSTHDPAQFRSHLQQQANQRRQAIIPLQPGCSEPTTARSRTAIDNYNREVRAYNQRLRANQQRMQQAIRQLQSRPCRGTRYRQRSHQSRLPSQPRSTLPFTVRVVPHEMSKRRSVEARNLMCLNAT